MNLDFTIPHIRYVSSAAADSGAHNKKSKKRYYLGGEPAENHRRLTVGKEYELMYLWYSPDRNTPRDYVWACKSDEENERGTKTYANVDPKNFGTMADLRDKKINQIID